MRSKDKRALSIIFKEAIAVFVDVSGLLRYLKMIERNVLSIPDKLFFSNLIAIFERFEESPLDDRIRLSAGLQKRMADRSFFEQFIIWINGIDDIRKRMYYADLFRCALINDVSDRFLYKLVSILNLHTSYELDYIRDYGFDEKRDLDMGISVFYGIGLFEQRTDAGHAYFVLSGFGKALKAMSLNYDTPRMGYAIPDDLDDSWIVPVTVQMTYKETMAILESHS